MSTAKLEQIRQQRDNLLNEIDRTASLPPDAATVQARIMGHFDLMIEDGEGKIRGFATAHGRGADMLPNSNLGMVLALLGRETITSLIKQRLPPETANGITQAERTERIATLKRQVSDVEREEEREVCRLEAAGHEVTRRGDADPALLLEVWDEQS